MSSVARGRRDEPAAAVVDSSSSTGVQLPKDGLPMMHPGQYRVLPLVLYRSIPGVSEKGVSHPYSLGQTSGGLQSGLCHPISSASARSASGMVTQTHFGSA